MIGVFGLKDNPIVAPLSVPPLVFTTIFKIVIMMYFERVSKPMQLDSPKQEEKSEEDKEEAQEEADEEFLQVQVGKHKV